MCGGSNQDIAFARMAHFTIQAECIHHCQPAVQGMVLR